MQSCAPTQGVRCKMLMGCEDIYLFICLCVYLLICFLGLFVYLILREFKMGAHTETRLQ